MWKIEKVDLQLQTSYWSCLYFRSRGKHVHFFAHIFYAFWPSTIFECIIFVLFVNQSGFSFFESYQTYLSWDAGFLEYFSRLFTMVYILLSSFVVHFLLPVLTRNYGHFRYYRCDSARVKKMWLDELERAKREILHEGILARQSTIRGKRMTVQVHSFGPSSCHTSWILVF